MMKKLFLIFLIVLFASCGYAGQVGVGQNNNIPIHAHSNVNDGGIIRLLPLLHVYGSGMGVTNNTATKIIMDTVVIDNGGSYSTVNNRYTPTVSGTYLFTGAIAGYGQTTLTHIRGAFYKNGSGIVGTKAIDMYANFTAITYNSISLPPIYLYMNGTTDYIELWCTLEGTGTLSVSGTMNAIRLSY